MDDSLGDCEERLLNPIKLEHEENAEVKAEPSWLEELIEQVEQTTVKTEVISEAEDAELGAVESSDGSSDPETDVEDFRGFDIPPSMTVMELLDQGRPQRRAMTLPTPVLRLARCDDPHWPQADARTNRAQDCAQSSQSSTSEVINFVSLPSVKLEQPDGAQLDFGFVDVSLGDGPAVHLEPSQPSAVDPLHSSTFAATSLKLCPEPLPVKQEFPDNVELEPLEDTHLFLKNHQGIMPSSSGSQPGSKPTTGAPLCENQNYGLQNENNKIYTDSLAKHKKLHSFDELRASDMCDERFCVNGDLLIHMRSHGGVKTHECDKCNAKFSRKCSLIVHIRSHLGMEHYACTMCGCDSDALSEDNDSDYSHKSPLSKNNDLDYSHKSPLSEDNDLDYSHKSPLSEDKRKHSGKAKFLCEVCRKRFTQKCHLNRHMRIHSGEKYLTCDDCKLSFTDKDRLKAHITRRHPMRRERTFACRQCNARFTNVGHLGRHNQVHSGEKPFVCDVCHSRFSQRSHLITHIRFHTGERPFGCDVCRASFAQKTHLTVHKRIHSGERPYACNECEARFMRSRDLTAHKRKH